LLDTVVNNTGVVRSQTIANKQGHIYLLGEGGALEVGGTLDASAPNGGNGGTIETSASSVSIAPTAVITTAAASGQTGSWVLDPQDFTIASSGGDMTGATLTSELASNNVTIESSGGSASGTGDINVNDTVSWSGHTLTLVAAKDIDINSTLTATGAASLNLEPGTANGSDSAVAGGTVNVAMSNGAFIGAVNFSGAGTLTIANQVYTVINSLGTASSSNDGTFAGISGNLAGYYALGSNIDGSATASWNSGAGITAMGALTGVLDGLGHTISGLKIDLATCCSNDWGFQTGLFAEINPTVTGANGIVRNVGLPNTAISALCYFECAILAGQTGSGASVANVFVTGTIATMPSQADDVGLLIGLMGSGSTITNAFASGAITGIGEIQYIGGLVGDVLSGSTITGGAATVDISGGNSAYEVGGLVGDLQGTVRSGEASGTITINGSGVTQIGGLVGSADPGSTISASSSSGPLVLTGGFLNIGGLVGSSYATMSNDTASGVVTVSGGGANIGGLVGGANAAISNSSASGAITVSDAAQDVGGLVGNGAANVISSFATGNISVGTNSNSIGGLVGLFGTATISGSYATGSITAASASDSYTLGGLVGDLTSGTITTSYATGNVTSLGAASDDLGGLIGYEDTTSSVSNAYATGTVSAGAVSFDIGGLVGGMQGATLTSSYAAGAVSAGAGSGNVGGLVGQAGGSANTFAGDFWDVTTTGQATSATGSGVGMTTAQMQRQANFTSATSANGSSDPAWDFTNTWVMYDGLTYPLLRVFMTPLTVSVNSTKTYDGTLAGDVVSYSVTPNTADLLGTLSITGAGVDVGSYAVTLSGLYSNQQGYIISYESGAITVEPAPLSITGSSVVTKTYDGTTVATIDVGTLSGLIDGDIVDVSATGVFSNAAVGSGKTVLVSYSLSGANADDYTLAGQTLLGDIVAAPATPAPAPAPTTTGATTANPAGSGSSAAEAQSLVALISVVDQGTTHIPLLGEHVPHDTPLPAPPPTLTTADGAPLLVSATPADAGDTAVDLGQLRLTLGLAASDPALVPLARARWITLLNGGVRLPDGVDQQFFLNSGP
jgi:hypothetical protein